MPGITSQHQLEEANISKVTKYINKVITKGGRRMKPMQQAGGEMRPSPGFWTGPWGHSGTLGRHGEPRDKDELA